MDLNKKFKTKRYIGIVGHRDIEMDLSYEFQVASILARLQKCYPNDEIIVVSALADGADRIGIYAAKRLKMRYDVLLPMPLETYVQDFDDDSFEEFMRLFCDARSSNVVPLCDECTDHNIVTEDTFRAKQYQAMGITLLKQCHHMIFLFYEFDAMIRKPGGTADILAFAKSMDKSYDIVPVERKYKDFNHDRCRKISNHLSE